MDIYLNTTAPLWAKSFYSTLVCDNSLSPPACVVYFYFPRYHCHLKQTNQIIIIKLNKRTRNKSLRNTPYRRHVLLQESTFCPSLETWGYRDQPAATTLLSLHCAATNYVATCTGLFTARDWSSVIATRGWERESCTVLKYWSMFVIYTCGYRQGN